MERTSKMVWQGVVLGRVTHLVEAWPGTSETQPSVWVFRGQDNVTRGQKYQILSP